MNPSPNPPPTSSSPRPRPRPGSGNSSRHSRRWLPWLGLALLLGLITAGFWPKPIPVETVLVQTGPLRTAVTEEGKTRVRHRFLVSAPLTGQLRRITLDPGDPVQAGDTVLAIIEPIPPALLDARSRQLAEARRDAATQQVERARAARRYTTSELQRFERLFADHTVSIQELEAIQWRTEAASRELGAAESSLREAEAALAEFSHPDPALPAPTLTEVKAPASGRVLRIPDRSARVVTTGQPLLEIGDPAELEVVIDVLSRDGAALRPGTRIELDHWGGPHPLEARVRLVEPAAFTKISALGVEEQRVNVIADLVTPPDQRPGLGDGFRVEARIITWETNATLKVPAGALFRRATNWAAFVVSHHRATLRPVVAGRSSSTEVQVLDGLQAGDAVIIHPGDRIQDGQRVRPSP